MSKKNPLIISGIGALLLTTAQPVGATSPLGTVPQPYGSGYGAGGLGDFLNNVISATLAGAGILFFFYLLFGGIKYLTAAEDEKAIEAARKVITNAIIGLIIVSAAYFIARVLETILGIQILNPSFTGP